MTLFVLLLAFVNRPGLTTPALTTNNRLHQNLLLKAVDKVTDIFSQPKSDLYSGRMLGVSCECTLHRTAKYASLSLWGVPVGGHLSGTAWFKSDGRTVVLDPNLERAVARRMTTVYQAYYRPKDDTVHIVLSVPVFGLKRMTLHRPPNQP